MLVVPVPSSAAARRSRGDAPLVALARRALAGFGPAEALLADALQPRRRVADQAGLGARARAVNLEHALVVRPRWAPVLEGAACVVVDDVLTTGATLVEADPRAAVRWARTWSSRPRSAPPSAGRTAARARANGAQHGTQVASRGLRVNVEPIPVSQTSGVVYRRYMAPLAPVLDTRTGRLGRGPKGVLRQGAEPQETPITGCVVVPARGCCRG